MATQFEPILILYAFLAVVQLILTMLPGVWYTRKVCGAAHPAVRSSRRQQCGDHPLRSLPVTASRAALACSAGRRAR